MKYKIRTQTLRTFLNLFTGLLLIFATHTVIAENKITFYHYDLLGSPVAATDEQGNIVWREEYSPWGKKLLNQDATKDNVRGYTGHVHDKETGLTYMQARYYDPDIVRFMGVDPVGFKESNPIMFNQYAYANNNPFKFVDPNGEMPGYIFSSDYFSSGQAAKDFTKGLAKAGISMAPGVGLYDGVNEIKGGMYFAGAVSILSEAPIAKIAKPFKSIKKAKGGKYGHVKGVEGNHAHHMPADSVSPVSKHNGPAISMKAEHHKQTASFGNTREARAYRKKQADLIENNKFKEAQDMDVDDIQSKFGDKYDNEIQDMQDYTDTIEF